MALIKGLRAFSKENWIEMLVEGQAKVSTRFLKVICHSSGTFGADTSESVYPLAGGLQADLALLAAACMDIGSLFERRRVPHNGEFDSRIAFWIQSDCFRTMLRSGPKNWASFDFYAVDSQNNRLLLTALRTYRENIVEFGANLLSELQGC